MDLPPDERKPHATNYVYPLPFCRWMILGLRHGPCAIPISAINTEESFMAFPSSHQHQHRDLQGFQGSSETLLNFLGTSFLHQYCLPHRGSSFLIPGKLYYIIREMAWAKAKVIMLIQVPLTSTDTKINAVHFMPLSSRPTLTPVIWHTLYNLLCSLQRQTPPNKLGTPSHSPFPVK